MEQAIFRPRSHRGLEIHLEASDAGLRRLHLHRTESGRGPLPHSPSGCRGNGHVVGAAARQHLELATGELEAYLAGRLRRFSTPLDLEALGSRFDVSVWKALLEIPWGQLSTYGEVASAVGRSGAARAVGGAVGRNPLAIIVPCHRVVGSNRRLTGFSGGLELKTILLEIEGMRLEQAPRLADWLVLS